MERQYVVPAWSEAAGVLGAGLAPILLLRLLGEIWMTQLRIQDRLALLVEQTRERRG